MFLKRRELLLFAALILIVTGIGAYYYFPRGLNFVPKGTYEKADRVLLEKRERRLTLFKNGTILKIYKIVLGRNPEGKKTEEGDNRTPEGHYIIDGRNGRSKFHLSLHISYPNKDDIAQANKRGVEPGGDIMIHGMPNGILGKTLNYDWTAGCAAVTNAQIEEIWEMVPNGTPIEIRP